MAKKVFKTVGSLAGLPFGLIGSAIGGTVGSLAGSLFGKKKSGGSPSSPAPVMPIADDEAVKRARRRSVASQMQRGGRTSTMLSDSDNSTLGG